MTLLRYLAYGSNLHPLRLTGRCPSVKAAAVVKLDGYELTLHKRSKKDGSGKCNLCERQGSTAYGVVYELDAAEIAALDAIEGKGYNRRQMPARFAEVPPPVCTYLADSSAIDQSLRPFHWYKKLVLAGANYHGMPSEYIRTIEAVESMPDLDVERNAQNEALLNQLALVSRS